MHERYFYPVDAIAIVLVFFFPKRWYCTLALCFVSLMTYSNYLVYKNPPVFRLEILALIQFIAIALIVKDFFMATKPSGWKGLYDEQT